MTAECTFRRLNKVHSGRQGRDKYSKKGNSRTKRMKHKAFFSFFVLLLNNLFPATFFHSCHFKKWTDQTVVSFNVHKTAQNAQRKDAL